MNLLSLLERRMPPLVPMGVGRVICFDPSTPLEAKEKRRRKRPEFQNQAESKVFTRAQILAVIAEGPAFGTDIVAATGLGKATVFGHCLELLMAKQIVITKTKRGNLHTLTGGN